jgi:hypothetical protein
LADVQTSDRQLSQEDGADWLLTDKVSSWTRTPAERGWTYLQQSLERHDSAQTDYRYSKAVLETILAHDKGSTTPPWLIQTMEVHQTSIQLRVFFIPIDHNSLEGFNSNTNLNFSSAPP